MNLAIEGFTLDQSFTIHHFSFGRRENFRAIKYNFPDTDIQHPLDGFVRQSTYKDVQVRRKDKIVTESKPEGMQTTFFVDAVPSVFESSLGDYFNTEIFQLKVSQET